MLMLSKTAQQMLAQEQENFNAKLHTFQQKTANLDRFRQMIEALPIAVMTCEVKNFTIDYVNKKSMELLESIRGVLKVDPSKIVGTPVDIFHKNPEYQRKLLSNPKNLPHFAQIQLGKDFLDLNIDALYDDQNKYTHAILSWSVSTDKVMKDRDSKRLLQMIDEMPLNVMTCDPVDFKINYVNQTSLRTLKKVEQYLPIKVEQLLGSTVDIFHKNPAHQRRLLADPNNLPHAANIKVGPEVLNLRVSAIKDGDGKYLGPMLSWSIITDNVKMAENVSSVVEKMADTSTSMNSSASSLLQLANRAESLSSSVAAASEQLSASVTEIASRITQASEMSREAAHQTGKTNTMVEGLAEAANKIGRITEVIEEIASKTNMLALNATIEAARAGDAGKGFAVVAGEVKALAHQTATATNEIKSQISDIQKATKDTVLAIREISRIINELSNISTQIAAAAEEQAATTTEVSKNINGVSDASRETGQAAQNVRTVSDDLNKFSATLNAEINIFLESSKK